MREHVTIGYAKFPAPRPRKKPRRLDEIIQFSRIPIDEVLLCDAYNEYADMQWARQQALWKRKGYRRVSRITKKVVDGCAISAPVRYDGPKGVAATYHEFAAASHVFYPRRRANNGQA